jgi:hypothetical protein
MDDHPPVIISADEYEFCLVGYEGDSFVCYRSTKKKIDKDVLLTRLRKIIKAIEQTDS